MHLHDVAVATMTWVRRPEEEPALRRALEALSRTGLPVTIADRTAAGGFTRFLRDLQHTEIRQVTVPTLPAQIATAIGAAAGRGTRYILYTEPDKGEFFRDHLVDFIRAAPDNEDAGVVLASRSPESFATFPRFQRYTETVANELCGEVIGVKGDYMYGPFLIARSLLPDVDKLDHSLGWGWRPFVFRQARRMGRSVLHVEGDYRCPPDQVMEHADDRTHRLAQLRQNIGGLLA